jgi:putative endonuclease
MRNRGQEMKEEKVSTRSRGKFGEEIAERYLLSQGYKILERNYQTRFGELDLIAEEGRALVFVEVKARESDEFGSPGDAVNAAKQRKLSRMAVAYVCDNDIRDRDCRFDVVEILLGPQRSVRSINLVRDAFDLRAGPFV